MPTTEDTTKPIYQKSYFNSGFIFIGCVFLFNIIINIISQVFGFYDLSYAEYFSIIIFYLFLLSCHFVLPERMPGDEPEKMYALTGSIDDKKIYSIVPAHQVVVAPNP